MGTGSVSPEWLTWAVMKQDVLLRIKLLRTAMKRVAAIKRGPVVSSATGVIQALIRQEHAYQSFPDVSVESELFYVDKGDIHKPEESYRESWGTNVGP
jgi:hypothetical protein